ncbi:MAG: Holliday junction branch migration protein RuvA [Acidobacteria bacterium]|nr:Holliday junction branch migration protein RuvA [Acidobacteriota bacterium]
MIAHLRGKLLSKRPNRVVIEAGGVGYEVFIPVSTFYDLGEVATEVSLQIYSYVRQESFSLYGFRTEREKNLFEKLLSVSGVGPKLAVTILSGLEVEVLIPALRNGEVATLVHVPGVGRKTAERLVLELKDKLADVVPEPVGRQQAPVAKPETVEDEVLSALINLGYARPAAENALGDVRAQGADGDFEELLRGSLRLLARKFFS